LLRQHAGLKSSHANDGESKMMQLDGNSLLACASNLERRQLTLARKIPFTIEVTPDRIEITPSTGTPRVVRAKDLQQMCDEYEKSNHSMKRSDYKSWCGSYLLALIVRCRQESR
jgi:hypothetical protein